MSAALGLLRLQQVDIRIGRNQARLQQIQEILDTNLELTQAREALNAAEAQRFQADQARRSAEAEARALQTKISQAESSLYDGSVKNPKELQGLQADVTSLRKHLAATEELELQAMMKVESAEADVSRAKQQLDQIESRLRTEHQILIDERSDLLRALDSLQTERHAAAGATSTRTLEHYEALRVQRRGVAVAEVADNACSACGTTLTAALQQAARHADQLIFCPSCGRILYAG